MTESGEGGPGTAPIPIPSEGGGAQRRTSADEAAQRLSYISGPHVITVQSFRSARAAPQAPLDAADGAGPPGMPPRRVTTGFAPVGGDAGTAAAARGAAATAAVAVSTPAAEPSRASDLEAPLLPPSQSAAAAAAQKRLRRQIDFAQGLSWGEARLGRDSMRLGARHTRTCLPQQVLQEPSPRHGDAARAACVALAHCERARRYSTIASAPAANIRTFVQSRISYTHAHLRGRPLL
jgi:hypothetical protein